MVANTNPIFGLTPKNTWQTLTTGDASLGGLTTAGLIMTAGADGSTLLRVFAKALGTNVASVLRIFLNNAGVIGTAANNTLLKDFPLPGTTLSQVGQMSSDFELNFNLKVQGAYKIYATLGTTVAAGWEITAESVDF